MVWLVVASVTVLVACMAVIGVLAWRAFKQVRSLGRTVAAASDRIADAAAALEEIAPKAP